MMYLKIPGLEVFYHSLELRFFKEKNWQKTTLFGGGVAWLTVVYSFRNDVNVLSFFLAINS